MNNNQTQGWWRDIFWLSIMIGLFFVVCLGSRALSVPDEGRYAEISREMLASHHFVTPHLDGVKYFEKPVWVYWVGAASLKFFGNNAWAARLPNMLMALLGSLACYAAGRQLFNRQTGLIAAVVLATSALYFAMAHSLTLDMTLSVWLTISLLCFITAIDLPHRSKARFVLCLGLYIAAALAVLTKGLIGLVFPGVIIFLWFVITQRWRELLHLHLISGIVVFLAVAAPWHILVQQQNPEFFHFYFVEQHFTRYLTKAMNRYQPWWWFLPILIGGFLPWVFFLPQALKQAWPRTRSEARAKHKEIFLSIWAIFIFVFFSLSDSKLIPYILPIFPAMALLVARFLSQSYLKRSTSHGISMIATGLLVALLAVGMLLAPMFYHALAPSAVMPVRELGCVLIVWLIGIVWWLYKGKSCQSMIRVLAIGSALLCWGLVFTVPALDSKPIKYLALRINTLTAAEPQAIVVSYGTYHQDLPFYVQKTVWIVNWRNELSFGLDHQPAASQWVMDQDAFWQKANTMTTPMYLIMDVGVYQHVPNKDKLHYIDRQGSDVLLRLH